MARFDQTFFKWLIVITAALLLLLFGTSLIWPALLFHTHFSLCVIALFVFICAALFYAGKSAAASSNKYAFNNLISISVFGKMALALAALLMYRSISNPPNQAYVGIFLVTYAVYTAFEIWFMTRLAKS